VGGEAEGALIALASVDKETGLAIYRFPLGVVEDEKGSDSIPLIKTRSNTAESAASAGARSLLRNNRSRRGGGIIKGEGARQELGYGEKLKFREGLRLNDKKVNSHIRGSGGTRRAVKAFLMLESDLEDPLGERNAQQASLGLVPHTLKGLAETFQIFEERMRAERSSPQNSRERGSTSLLMRKFNVFRPVRFKSIECPPKGEVKRVV